MTSNLLAALTAHRTSKNAPGASTHPLHDAARKGNLEDLSKALDEPKVKVDQKDSSGHTALMVASEKGSLEIAKHLCERGARVAAKDDDGQTAVMKAAIKGYHELVLFLIDAQCGQRKITKGLNVDISAALANEKKRVVDAKDDEGETALMKVAATGSLELFKLLLEQKASPEARDDHGWTPLTWAALEGRLPILEYCVTDLMMVVDQTTEKGETLLQKAAVNGHLEVCEFLVTNSCKVNQSDAEQQTPLMWAAGAGRDKVVEYFIKQDAKVEGESRSGKTALHFASTFGHIAIADALIDDKGAGGKKGEALLAKQDEQGQSALMLAVSSGRYDMAMLLLEKKCAVDKVNKRGMTALAIAAEQQQLDCCKLLINHKADLYIQDENGQQPADHAEGTLNAKVVELFRQAMMDTPETDEP